MLEAARARFQKQFGCPAEAIYFAPGRINLIGEHTDYNGGWVLPAAIDLGNYFLVAGNRTGRVRIFSTHYAEEVEISPGPDLDKTLRRRWQDYFIGVMLECIDRPGELPGLDVLVESTLPPGGGLSSSASITAGFATILNDFWVMGYTREQLAAVAQDAENNHVGVACGVLDPFAVLMGQAGCALALDCATKNWTHVPFPSKAFRIIAANTGVSRKLADSGYNTRRAECERALSLLRQSHPAATLSDASLADLEEAVALRQDDIALRRARHVVSENMRVLGAVAALESGDLQEFGRLLVASHASLRDDFEVSCTELDMMVAEALRLPGIAGAKMTGAGFGGCVVAIARADAVEETVAELKEQYRGASGRDADIHVCSPGSGVARLA